MSTGEVERALDGPVAERGNALLRLTEDQWFDRKSKRIRPRSLANDLTGFANAEGGTVVIGLWKGTVEGIRSAPTMINEWQQAAVDYTDPPVRVRNRRVDCVTDDGEVDQLLVIDVEPSEFVHANTKDEVYLRIGDETRRLSYRQRQELLYDKGQAAFEGTVVKDAVQEDLDEELLRDYAAAVRHANPGRLLKARGLLNRKTGRVTAAALLLFGHEPQEFFPEAYVRVLRYRGRERGTGKRQQLVDEVRREGPIPTMLMATHEAVRELQPTRRALGEEGRFVQVGLIPEDAWLEGLVNAVVHRSYSLGGDHVRVEIFDDRIEVESPGRFPGLVDPSEPLRITRFARNPRIARVCADLNWGQELGEGIRRIYEEMRLAGLSDPLYQQTSASVRLTLLALPASRELEASLPAGSREILRLLSEAGRLGTGDIQAMVDLSRPATLRRLRALANAGLVEWVGNSPKDPRAYWQLATRGSDEETSRNEP